jgi:transcriptional regulator with XRE-family HTH domain
MNPKVERFTKPEPPEDMLPGEIQLCEMLCDPEYALTTKTKLAKELGVSRQTLYDYLSKKRVVDYMAQLIDYYTDLEVPNVWKALVRKAKKEDLQAIRLFFEMKGKYIPPTAQTQIALKDSKATINIISSIPRPSGALTGNGNIIEADGYEVDNA